MVENNEANPKKISNKHKFKFSSIVPIKFSTRDRKKKQTTSLAETKQTGGSLIGNKRDLNYENNAEDEMIKSSSVRASDFFNNHNNRAISAPQSKRAKLVSNEIELKRKTEIALDSNAEVEANNTDESSILTYGISNYKSNKGNAFESTPLNSMRRVSADSIITSGDSPLKIASTNLNLDNDLVNFESIGVSSPTKNMRSSQVTKSQQRRISMKKKKNEHDIKNNSADTSSLINGLNSSLCAEGNYLCHDDNILDDESIREITDSPPRLSPEKTQDDNAASKPTANTEDVINKIKELYGSDAFETSKIDEGNDQKIQTFKNEEQEQFAADKKDDMTDSDSSDDSFIFEMLQRQVTDKQRSKTCFVKEQETDTQNWLPIDDEHLKLLKYSRFQCKTHFPFLRLLIMKIDQIEYDHFVLMCSDIQKKVYTIHLYPPWTHEDDVNVSPYQINEVIHIVSFKVDDPLLLFQTIIHLDLKSELLLVVSPDTLLSGTTLSDGLTCQRQTVIKKRFALPSEPSIHLTRGTIIHELFQHLLQLITANSQNLEKCADLLTTDNLSRLLANLMQKYKLEIIFSTDISINEFQISLERDFFPNIKQFLSEYIVSKGTIGLSRIKTEGSASLPFKIKKIHSIEETIDSPLLGLKGIIDATIYSNFGLIPMEIKTGKNVAMKHQTQTLIYALLMREKYDIPIKKFLLVYLGGDGTYTLNEVVFNEFKIMLHFRNKLISFFKDEINDNCYMLPDLLKGSSATCKRECAGQETCTILNHITRLGDKNIAIENLDDNVLLPQEFVDLITGEISYKDKFFFEKYYRMMQLEDESNALDINGYFLNSSAEKNQCVGMMKLIETKQTNQSEGVEDRYELVFSFDPNINNEVSGVNLQDNCILSDEMGHYRLDFVVVLDVDYSKGVLKTLGTKNIMASIQNQYKKIVLFRLDHALFDIPNKIAKYSLVSLLDKRNLMLKNLIINPELNLSNQRPEYFKSFNTQMINWAKLNVDQSEAIIKCLSSDKYSLIRGMPGTGKTQVITELLKCFIMNGKKVLITSFTHSAVDNILLKLIENGDYNDNFNIVRLGQKKNIHPKVQRFMLTENVECHSDLQLRYREANLVATTCLSANSYMIGEILKIDDGSDIPNYRKFDYCILDEATQINLPISLAPLKLCKKFILVGDDKQLSPLVKNKEAVRLGLKESLFTILSRIDSKNVTNLTIQYRMNEDIMKLSNYLVYNNLLKCGSINKNRYLPEIEGLHAKYSEDSLEFKLLDNKQSVLFIDYKNKAANPNEEYFVDKTIKDSLVNLGEVSLISDVVKLFKKNYGGHEEFNLADDLGILSIYRAQLDLLRDTLCFNTSSTNLASQTEKHLEILTADQYQGRDKKCIIISFVKSSLYNNPSTTPDVGILNDLERINVSITRSKCKLIMVGNSRTLSGYSALKKLFEGVIFKEKDKYVYEM